MTWTSVTTLQSGVLPSTSFILFILLLQVKEGAGGGALQNNNKNIRTNAVFLCAQHQPSLTAVWVLSAFQHRRSLIYPVSLLRQTVWLAERLRGWEAERLPQVPPQHLCCCKWLKLIIAGKSYVNMLAKNHHVFLHVLILFKCQINECIHNRINAFDLICTRFYFLKTRVICKFLFYFNP